MNKKNQNETFEKQMLFEGLKQNTLTVILCYIYIFFSSELFKTAVPSQAVLNLTDYSNSIELKKMLFIFLFLVTLLLIGILQATISPFANHLLTSALSKQILLEDKGELDENKRIVLVKKILRCPVGISIEATVFFILLNFLTTALIIFLFTGIESQLVYLNVTIPFAGFNCGIKAYNYAENICSERAKKIIAKGINKDIVYKENYWGISFPLRIVLFFIIPFVFSNIMQFTYLWMAKKSNIAQNEIIFMFCLIVILNTLLTIALSSYAQIKIRKSYSGMNKTLEKINDTGLKEIKNLKPDLSDKISYNNFLINEIIDYMKKKNEDTIETGERIFTSTKKISEISSKITQTASEKKDSAKKSIAELNISHSNLAKISEIFSSISKTSTLARENVKGSSRLLEQIMNIIDEISSSIMLTTDQIRNLSEEIDKIKIIINKIDSIAEQTKIIAYNAELEASVSKEDGEKFHIIANEVRRLTTSINESVLQTIEKLQNIQKFSDNMIISSESETQKVIDEKSFLYKIKNKFHILDLSSEITNESILKMDTTAKSMNQIFYDIELLLDKIINDFSNFEISSKKVQDESIKLTAAATYLNRKKTGLLVNENDK